MSKKVKGKKYLNVFHIRWVFFLAVSVIIGGIMSFGLVAYLVFGFKNNTAIHMLWMIPLMTITIAGALLIVLHFMEKRLSKLMNAIHEVSGGNLDVEIDLNDAQEYEVVYKDFNKMVKELRLTKQEMQNTVNEIAHEFKTPITSICGFADYLYQTGGEIETEERLNFLKLISDQAGRLSNLSQNMLLLSKLEACQIMTDKRMFDVAEQINKCIILFLEQLDKKNIEILVPEDVMCTCYGNEEMLEQVWINLIGNAVKYTPEGGVITVSYKQSENHITVSIRDSGIGMDDDTKAHIFEKYYQNDSSNVSNGNGIGLAIVKRIVDLSDGKVYVKSRLKHGSTFYVELPIE